MPVGFQFAGELSGRLDPVGRVFAQAGQTELLESGWDREADEHDECDGVSDLFGAGRVEP